MSEIKETDWSDNFSLYVEVVLPLPLMKLYTYRLPSDLYELAMPGKRVFVPFGNRKVYTGIIVSVNNQKPEKYEALNVISIIDDTPLVSNEQLQFWQWIADYYMCGLGDVMNAALPAGLKLTSESFIAIQDGAEYDEDKLDQREVLILNALKGKEKIKVSELEILLKSKTSFVKMIKSLYDRQLIVMFEDVTDKYKPKTLSKIRLNKQLGDEFWSEELNQLERKAKLQFRAVMALFGEKNQEAVKSELIKKYELSSNAIKALVEKGIFEAFEETTDRFIRSEKESEAYELSEEQNVAINEIKSQFQTHSTVLLHGVTNSGKTFVYIDLIREMIDNGKSVIYLVPELALTEQLVKRLEHYFGSVMMVAHSRFTQNEKVEIWQKCRDGEVKLLIGPRSAVFTPVQNLGLIIVDEEHENTFKQSEKAPRYNARDTAMVLAARTKAKVLLGSATPSVETYYNAKTGKYGLVEMQRTFGSSRKAEIIFGDIKEETKKKTMHGVFTSVLYDKIQTMKQHQKQAIVFQNRKGFVPMLECSVCGWVSKCINCDIALTYYKYSNNLRCHYCGYHQENITKCQACGNHSMSIQGYGTERITEELQLMMPDLRIIRFDQDSTRQKHAFKKLIHEFETGQADVIVGTQIAVKGLDFDHVSLSAVINADHLLNFPDFRSHERTFQLLTQLAGRAGRREERGTMVIQSRQVEHPVLRYVENYNYKGFFDDQITERKQFHYPPFTRIVKLTLKHKSHEELQKASSELAMLLKKQLGPRVLGPETPHVSKIKNLHIRNILIKMDAEKDNPKTIKKFITKTFDFLVQKGNYKNLVFVPDVDGY